MTETVPNYDVKNAIDEAQIARFCKVYRTCLKKVTGMKVDFRMIFQTETIRAQGCFERQ
jgi:hypothetical protein